MKKLLLLSVILLPVLLRAQNRDIYLEAFTKSIPKDLGTAIHLPKLDYGAEFNIEDIAPYDAKQRILVINSDSLFHKIFSRYTYTKDSLARYRGEKDDAGYQWMLRHMVDSIPVIDFKTKELVLYSACGQCLANCNHKESDACHRNVCEFSNSWFIRDKTPVEQITSRKSL
jgi:hypothetical protein